MFLLHSIRLKKINKVNQYKSKAKFEVNRKRTSNANDFLENINMKVGIEQLNNSNISRAAQLCQKTNQMNLRLVRHDESSIQKLVKDERSFCFLVTLSDDFGDHGIISLVILTQSNVRDKAFLDTFLMSCRVLGRELEYFIFDYIKNKLKDLGYKYLEAEYIKGERNTPAKKILQNMGLDLISKKENEIYKISLAEWRIKNEKRLKKLFTYYES